MSIRHPSVAGMFYPGEKADLRRKIASLTDPQARRLPAIAVLVPHAGYDYSGPVTGAVFSRTEVPPEVIVVSFSHRMEGPPVAVWAEGAWRTPLGTVEVAGGLVDRIRAAYAGAEADESVFRREHSGEVQVPFLQAARPDVRIAPVSLNTHDGATLKEFGAALAGVAGGALVVATTDLTHCGAGYGIEPPAGKTPREWAREQDRRVLDRVSALDFDGFLDVVREHEVSMCGIGPTAAMIAYARARGAAGAEIVRYATSADDEPEADRAVGYPGAIVRTHVEAQAQ